MGESYIITYQLKKKFILRGKLISLMLSMHQQQAGYKFITEDHSFS